MATEKNTESAYVNGYHPSVMKSHAWRNADNCCPHLLPTVKEMYKGKVHLLNIRSSNPSLTLLDIGAGVGTITLSLATYMPKGHVTALDLTDEVLHMARTSASAQGITNVTFATGNVLSLPYPDGHFDIVCCSQMIGHIPVPDRPKAISEMLRVCKPGGKVACREGNVSTLLLGPANDWYPRWKKIMDEQLLGDGAHVINTGVFVKGYFIDQGCKDEDVKGTASTDCWSDKSDRVINAEAWAERTLESKYKDYALSTGVSLAELEEIAQGWRDWAQNPAGWAGIMHSQVLVTKR